MKIEILHQNRNLVSYLFENEDLSGLTPISDKKVFLVKDDEEFLNLVNQILKGEIK